MPIIANAKKALRQSKTRADRNSVIKARVRNAVKKTTPSATAESLTSLYSIVDKAVKKNILHKNTAARIKASASKRVVAETKSKTTAKPAAKKVATAKKTAKTAKKSTATKATKTKKTTKSAK